MNLRQVIKSFMSPDDMSPRRQYLRQSRELQWDSEQPASPNWIKMSFSPEDYDGYDRYLEESSEEDECPALSAVLGSMKINPIIIVDSKEEDV